MPGHGITQLQESFIGKDSSSDPKPHNLKDVMIQSMRNSAEIVAEVLALWERAEDARAIVFSLFDART